MVDIFISVEPAAGIPSDDDFRLKFTYLTGYVFPELDRGDQLSIRIMEKNRFLDPEHSVGRALFLLAQTRQLDCCFSSDCILPAELSRTDRSIRSGVGSIPSSGAKASLAQTYASTSGP